MAATFLYMRMHWLFNKYYKGGEVQFDDKKGVNYVCFWQALADSP